jgi:AmiR/NasT family two-component response regulator
MQTAMEHRAVTEQAKGITMRERRCAPNEAFAMLTTLSQNSNRKLRDIAAALVASAMDPVSGEPPVRTMIRSPGSPRA